MNRRELLAGAAGAAMAKPHPRGTWRVGVIGRTGRGDYGHDLDVTWLDVPEARVVAVADESEPGRSRAAERLKCRAYADYREMLRQERPEIVSVAPRWLDCHRDMALACAEAGVRGVLMEKPLCRDLTEADQIAAACARTGMKIAMAFQTRYSPRVAVVKRLLAEGRIGTVLELRGRGKEDHRGGGEDLMVLGVHVFDLMRHLAGDPLWCFARVSQAGRPATGAHVRDGNEGIGPLTGDALVAAYGFPNGVVGHFASGRAPEMAGRRFFTTVFGTKGLISIGHGTLPPVRLLDDPSWTLGGRGGAAIPVSSAGPGLPEPLTDASLRAGNVLIARDLIRCVEQDRQPLAGLREGIASLEMVMAVYESHRLGRPVDLPLRERRHPLALLAGSRR